MDASCQRFMTYQIKVISAERLNDKDRAGKRRVGRKIVIEINGIMYTGFYILTDGGNKTYISHYRLYLNKKCSKFKGWKEVRLKILEELNNYVYTNSRGYSAMAPHLWRKGYTIIS
jgi:hypothetical protein